MEHHSELKRNSRDQKQFETFAKATLPQVSQRIDPQDRFNLEKPNLSYAYLHHEITRNAKDISPKSSRNHQKQRMYRKENYEDELVKYMSKLPNYLERGKNPQEKVLNVGVLDWGRLEKWQCSQKQIPHGGGRSSVSSSNLSSSSSSDASSSHSSRRYISSPHHKMHRPSLQFHLMSSPVEGHLQVVKSSGQSVERFRDLTDAKSKTLNKQNKFIGKQFGNALAEIKPEECKGKDSNLKIGQESRTLPNGVKYDLASTTKMEMKGQDGQYVKRAEKLQEGNPGFGNQDVPGIEETVVLLLPTDLCQSNDPRTPSISDSTTLIGHKPAETRRRSFAVRSKDVGRYCEVDNSRHSQMKQNGCKDPKIDSSSKRSHSVPRSAKVGICPSGGGNLDDRKSATTVNKLTANEPLMVSDLKASKIASEKARSTSPFCRLSFGMGKIGKNSGLKEASALPQLSTTYVSAQSGSENGVASSGFDTSNTDKPNATSRARSSPLRRLLDPILKSKPTNCGNNVDRKETISKDRASKSSDSRPYSLTIAGQSGKVKLDMTGCRIVDVNNSFQEKKHGSPAVQALFRVAVKNGQPLFTFAVDNESDILAATLKKLSTSRKEDYSCIYTFFTIQEVKKKYGRWLNQGGKGQRHDYIPNVVAQMKVSDSHSSNLIKENYVDRFSLREFVLSSVELRQADQQTSDFQPNEELAAVVVKIPMRISRSSLRDGYQSDMHKDHPELGLRDHLPEETFDSNSGTKIENHPLTISQDIGATVILPSGVHALPHKGEPSSLIQRWRSGGSCDCGGWDLGCKLRILANWNQLIRKAGSSEVCSPSNQFELFYQVI